MATLVICRPPRWWLRDPLAFQPPRPIDKPSAPEPIVFPEFPPRPQEK